MVKQYPGAQVPSPIQNTPNQKRSKLPIIIAVVAVVWLCVCCAVLMALPKLLINGGIIEDRSSSAYTNTADEEQNDEQVPNAADGGDFGIIAPSEEQSSAPTQPVSGDGDYTPAKMSINYSYFGELDRSYFAIDGKVLDDTVEGRVRGFSASLDQSKAVLFTIEGGVFLLSADGLKRIADDGSYVAISPDGSKGAYADYNGVYLFETADKGKLQKIDSYVNLYGWCLSPNGNTLVYNVRGAVDNSAANTDDEFSSGYDAKIYLNGEAKVIVDAYALSTSNDGEYIYFVRPSDNNLYVFNATSEITKKIGDFTVSSGASASFNPFFFTDSVEVNKDCTEMIYSGKDAVFYVEKDGSPQKISETSASEINMIVPTYASCYKKFDEGEASHNTYLQGSSSLKAKVYKFDTELVYLDENAAATPLAANAQQVHLSNDGKMLHYLADSIIYFDNLTDGALPSRYTERVSQFALTNDQQHIYYVDEDNNLVCATQYGDPNPPPVTCASDIAEGYDMVMLSNNRLYFLVNPKTETGALRSSQLFDLYYTENGSKPVRVAYGVNTLSDQDQGLGMSLQFSLGNNNDEVYVIHVEKSAPVKLCGAPSD